MHSPAFIHEAPSTFEPVPAEPHFMLVHMLLMHSYSSACMRGHRGPPLRTVCAPASTYLSRSRTSRIDERSTGNINTTAGVSYFFVSM